MLAELIQSQIVKVSPGSKDAPPNAAECLTIERVATFSVASFAGLAAGDLLVALNGRTASKLDPYPYRRPFEEGLYRFYSPARQEHFRLTATGIDIGVKLRPTPAGVAATFTPNSDPEQLEVVWEAGDWKLLETLCAKGLPGVAGGGFLRRLFTKPCDRNTPLLAFLGAALYEQGRQAEGRKLMAEYDSRYRPDWTVNYGAVIDYYQALDLIASGDPARAGDLLADAYEKRDFERIAARVEALQGTRPVKSRRWQGQTFPCDYELPVLEGNGTVSLSRTLSAMQPGQILMVCLLATYRGNGPYNDFMAHYRNYITHLRPFIHGLHVITMTPERNPEYSHYYKTEDEIHAAGLPFDLLLEQGELTNAIGQSTSPYVLMLDAQATILCEGEFESVDLWNAVAAAAAAAGQA